MYPDRRSFPPQARCCSLDVHAVRLRSRAFPRRKISACQTMRFRRRRVAVRSTYTRYAFAHAPSRGEKSLPVRRCFSAAGALPLARRTRVRQKRPCRNESSQSDASYSLSSFLPFQPANASLVCGLVFARFFQICVGADAHIGPLGTTEFAEGFRVSDMPAAGRTESIPTPFVPAGHFPLTGGIGRPYNQLRYPPCTCRGRRPCRPAQKLRIRRKLP